MTHSRYKILSLLVILLISSGLVNILIAQTSNSVEVVISEVFDAMCNNDGETLQSLFYSKRTNR